MLTGIFSEEVLNAKDEDVCVVETVTTVVMNFEVVISVELVEIFLSIFKLSIVKFALW